MFSLFSLLVRGNGFVLPKFSLEGELGKSLGKPRRLGRKNIPKEVPLLL